MDASGQLLTQRQAAERLAVSRKTVHRLRQSGVLRTVHVGRAVRVPEADVITMSEGGSVLGER